jgi:vacuolar-type H+-ATPase subunit E/Vma4
MSKTAEDWKKERDEADRIRNENAKALSELQRNAIKQAWKAIQETEFSMREMFDVTMDDCRAINEAEWKLRFAFPELCKKKSTCDD